MLEIDNSLSNSYLTPEDLLPIRSSSNIPQIMLNHSWIKSTSIHGHSIMLAFVLGHWIVQIKAWINFIKLGLYLGYWIMHWILNSCSITQRNKYPLWAMIVDWGIKCPWTMPGLPWTAQWSTVHCAPVQHVLGPHAVLQAFHAGLCAPSSYIWVCCDKTFHGLSSRCSPT